jgi:diguanylate cyclase (GGDEF)-like protein/PAS domain S-box-containing protein
MMKPEHKQVSIKSATILVFVGIMVVAASAIGYLIFTSWHASAKANIQAIADHVSESIHERIDSFMKFPMRINQANRTVLELGLLDIADDQARDTYFVNGLVAQAQPIYSISYGMATGGYYGARRNEHGVVEVMRNNAATAGNSWYYSVNDDLSTGALAVQAGPFDPRTRAWYQAAATAHGPSFSPVYKHFIMDDLAISAAEPVYGANGELRGVVGTHLLLSGLATFLQEIVLDHGGSAVLVERTSGLLIANSMGKDNFSVSQDGSWQRSTIDALGDSVMSAAYGMHRAEDSSRFVLNNSGDAFHVIVRQIVAQGLDWIAISVVPEGAFLDKVYESIRLTALLVAFTLALAALLYHIVAQRLFRPVDELLRVSSAIASGDLSKRVAVVRHDEIGGISHSLNNLADSMQVLVNDLASEVERRTTELQTANQNLEESNQQLQLILDSAAEGVYGIDRSGICMFCNLSSLQLLGYSSQDELLGKNMHAMIHHSRRDGKPFSIEDCKIFQSIQNGEGFEAEDEVFWRKDGTSFDVSYHAYPQIRDGKVIGGVITFSDITERRQKEAQIQFLNCHDSLTGLSNRRCFEQQSQLFDVPGQLPLSVLFADINGLKMTNDIFGHAAGDELIKKTAAILRQSCRADDLIARVGGDEFIVLLPKTTPADAAKIVQRIREGFEQERVSSIRCSISIGCDTKNHAGQSLQLVMANAENGMYKDKAVNRKAVNDDIIETIQETLHARNPNEHRHALAVRELCGRLGRALGLSATEVSKAVRSGYLHDIGKITLEDRFLLPELVEDEDFEYIREHPVVGYRILNLFDDTVDVAEYVYGHHEHWDGTGYPRGLAGDHIPLISRIIAITESYERALNRGDGPYRERKRRALAMVAEGSGTRFDPYVVTRFMQIMENDDAPV